MKQIFLLMLLASSLFTQAQNKAKKDAPKSLVTHPEWAAGAVIYEVNVRQFSAEGTFRAVEKELPRLKKMGVDILWLMPIHPIGKVERKGSLGSYYAVQDYDAINPEFGNMDDFQSLVKNVHAQGMKIIIDWVANHTAPDNKWVKEHPEYYLKDKNGKFLHPVEDWTDVIDLDYSNPMMCAAMQGSMIMWVKRAGIDGFRRDVAEMVPMEFWLNTREILNNVMPDVFMLAEGDKPELHQAFDMTYDWKTYHAFKALCKNEAGKDMAHVAEVLDALRYDIPQEGLRMQFTSNHDENSWNATEYEAFGNNAKTMAALMFTLPGMPLIYNGQEAAFNHRLKFFDKDPIQWGNYSLMSFYASLIKLKKSHPALQQLNRKGSFNWIIRGNDKKVMAFSRTHGKDQVWVAANFSEETQVIDLPLPAGSVFADYLSGKPFPGGKTDLEPNSFRIFIAR